MCSKWKYLTAELYNAPKKKQPVLRARIRRHEKNCKKCTQHSHGM